MKEMEAHVGKFETQLKQWGARLDELAARAEDVGAEAKHDYNHSIDDLKAKYQVAKFKLEELKGACDETWETFKTGVENACNELDVALNKLKD